MAKSKANYSVLVDVELDTSTVQKQLNDATKKIKIDLDDKPVKESAKSMEDLGNSVEETSLTFQAANEVFSKAIEIIGSMVEEVYELDGALTEFRKVSSLSGSALEEYVSQLSDMGDAVARTGKPKCQAPDVGMANQH